jgi:DNA polymerase III epsilon subunit-like protein
MNNDVVYIIYDVESTSCDPIVDEIISFACVPCIFNGKTFQHFQYANVNPFNSKIKTDRKIDINAYDVHNIKTSDINESRSFIDVMNSLAIWVKNILNNGKYKRTVFLAHNGRKFDDMIWISGMLHHNIDPFKFLMCELKCFGFLDSIVILRKLTKERMMQFPVNHRTGRKSFTLESCYFMVTGDIIQNAHDALVDTNALVRVMSSEIVSLKIDIPFIFKCIKSLKHMINDVRRLRKIKHGRRNSKFDDGYNDGYKDKTKTSIIHITHAIVDKFCLTCMSVICSNMNKKRLANDDIKMSLHLKKNKIAHEYAQK